MNQEISNQELVVVESQSKPTTFQKTLPVVMAILFLALSLGGLFLWSTFGEIGRYDERVNFNQFLTKSECKIVDLDSDGNAKLTCPSKLTSKELDGVAGAAYLDRRSNGELWVSYWPNKLAGHYRDDNTKYMWAKEPSVGYVGEINQRQLPRPKGRSLEE
jgi:hypothetical protein